MMQESGAFLYGKDSNISSNLKVEINRFTKNT